MEHSTEFILSFSTYSSLQQGLSNVVNLPTDTLGKRKQKNDMQQEYL